jgi:hypothetical protein
MKEKDQNKLTETDLIEAKEWLNKSAKSIPPAVLSVFTILINMYLALSSGIYKFKCIQNFLAKEMGIVPKSEKIISPDKIDPPIKAGGKRKLKRKKVKNKFSKTRAGQKQEVLAINTPTHASPEPETVSDKIIEKHHPLASCEENINHSISENNSNDEVDVNKKTENKELPADIINVIQEQTAADIYLVAKETTFKLLGKKDTKTGITIFEKHPEVAQGSSFTFRSIATFLVLHVGVALHA